ncbi:MAG TPA: hypothetical protein VGA89_00480 [Patescibacteria group bacterium]|jgi:hypothetical protein
MAEKRKIAILLGENWRAYEQEFINSLPVLFAEIEAGDVELSSSADLISILVYVSAEALPKILGELSKIAGVEALSAD